MTVKDLKEALVNVPDDAEVYVDNGFVISDCIEYDEYNNRFFIAELCSRLKRN